ncbi:MAG: acyl-phosphate glycerol 3-phosphate acyltransferase [Sphingobacteriales bacterium 17-39-43]|uniref:glycerol-3-phosphate 1-O-acyltransferase PlsY n=1 Tax=Daejeonella sp. TaxID=2805397 RepID=UPI000BC5E5B5|nr:glycerol-3-phosphate 1-O-acyltransferase PlsY [Daejeonella sp.]OYX99652.1 MAG: acyl-phosphate glycerol 3-phosphate acyltransferase [Sphingobacteriia bacterium 35-40-5]OYZ33314.1 MAG: acyl-phosphate glycerol 3-phosphate acyltransferase [Sphingobacteriales bacterium 16-39-50]OZA26723.1 MAG: acyl-phosphate glycerol 3-phosphate acyltransferase [Sphingobacteriales bacterium 17-39-43]OZA58495.1 MAG: acyl-phosphate glycerol 3-phosphate acyltransferase [Sphingobacteriales bacterium 39-40-5]HQS51898
MISIYSLSALILAYLFGSIPTAVWIGQAFYGIDVREYGSGNAGATNTFRVLGKKAGIAVMFLDIFKGYTATNLAYLIGLSVTGPQNSVQFVNYQLALGVTAVLGHLFPVFAGFRGGKGVATLFGMILAVHSEAAMLCVLTFVVFLLIFKYVSLSSIMAGFSFPLSIIFIFQSPIRSVLLYGMCICVLILVTHQKNIERLLKGKESRVDLFKRKAH